MDFKEKAKKLDVNLIINKNSLNIIIKKLLFHKQKINMNN
jgi:hypothetical protein